ncbi:MAG: 2,3-bisphosphoglycerate-independent phosphoglycerate mutase [Bacteroidota bacterium]|nr:2,3-bisphosphoglycerate-independent phosphoglycerate mutase [Bacteroidota bacterium]
MSQKVALLILDGWGLGSEDQKSNAALAANTPYLDSLFVNYPNAHLAASGEDVGLPDGQMGNSEVGHMNIGAGRIVWQQLVLINAAFEQGAIKNNPEFAAMISYCKINHKPLHLIGLVSDGGVHSSILHLESILTLCHVAGLNEVYIHAFTDGRDTDPKSGLKYLTRLQQHCDATTGQVASIIGRYYAMDRDHRWERIKKAYDVLVNRGGEHYTNVQTAISNNYERGITDEFIEPMVAVNEAGEAIPGIQEGDAVFFFNFRTDRGRHLTKVLTQSDMPEYNMKAIQLYMVTMTQYDETFSGIHVMFPELKLFNTIGEVLQDAGKTQLRMAETEKYPHVTFFMNGGRETPFNGEQRLMVASPKVATYDLQPEMSAFELTAAVCKQIEEQGQDCIILNFANPDMVGHTGVFNAVIKALETIDTCTQELVNKAISQGYAILMIADHGNCEYMVNADGSPNTAHTTNLVPILIINDSDHRQIRSGRLADVAPTMLDLLGIAKPLEMTGQTLLVLQSS